MLMEAGKTKGLEIVPWSTLRHKTLEGYDRDWSISHALVKELAHVQRLESLKLRLLGLLPSQQTGKELSEYDAQLTKIKQSELFQFVPTEKSGALLASMNPVTLMEKGKLVKATFDAYTGMERTVADALICFCSFKALKPGTVEVVITRGVQALAARIADVRANENATDIGEKVDAVLLYNFMLSPENKNAMETLAANHIIVAPSTVSSKKGAKKPKTSTDKTQMELAMEAAENIFD